MANPVFHVTWAVCVIAVMKIAVVEPVPVDSATVATNLSADNEKPSKLNVGADEVKQLEDLKQHLGKTFSYVKAHSELQLTEADGHKAAHVEKSEAVVNNGDLVDRFNVKMDTVQDDSINATPVSHLRAEIEIPAAGVHRVVEEAGYQGQREVADNAVERRSPPDISNHLDSKYSSFSGVQYSPRDMAEYVFWTGDEKGVTLSIEEFLDDGVMTREEAIRFLQEIKLNIDYLQLHYSRQQRFLKQPRPEQEPSKDKVMMIQKDVMPDPLFLAKKNGGIVQDATQMQEEAVSASKQPSQNQGLTEDDYEELLERLKVADFLYTEYSLEEVIYQLAKVMFSQSLAKGSSDAQEALQKFTAFLSTEAEKGHISPGLEKKVLDVLIASLADTLSEPSRLSSAVAEHNTINTEASTPSPKQLLQQLLMLNAAADREAQLPLGSSGNKAQNLAAGTGNRGREMRESGNKDQLEPVRKGNI